MSIHEKQTQKCRVTRLAVEAEKGKERLIGSFSVY